MSRAMSTKRCKACIYRGYASGDTVCDYMGIVGHMRPCLPGDQCTVRSTGDKPSAARGWATKTRKWDTAKATEMRAQGMTYPAIAAELGTTKAAVAIYFSQKRREGIE